MVLPDDLQFRTKGQLAIDICTDAYADGVRFDVICADETYGGCTQLREVFEQQQAYVLRMASTFMIVFGVGVRLTCRQAAQQVDHRQWEVRSAAPGPRDNGGTRGRASPPRA
nr:transposase [Micromonospora inyonensis]